MYCGGRNNFVWVLVGLPLEFWFDILSVSIVGISYSFLMNYMMNFKGMNKQEKYNLESITIGLILIAVLVFR